MTHLRTHLALIWAIAILLAGTTQLMHAFEDHGCDAEHSTCDTSPTEERDCPTEHTCCHGQAPTVLATFSNPTALALKTILLPLHLRDERPTPGRSREIDHPPQLS